MTRKQLNVRLPEELLQRIDERRTQVGLGRSEWVEKALTYMLQLPIRERPIETKERI